MALRYRASDIALMTNGEVEVAVDAHGRTRHMFSDSGARSYPHYFDPDQLYDLGTDRWEQQNRAGDAAVSNRLARMQAALQAHQATFDHPFARDADPFQRSEAFRDLAKAREEQAKGRNWWHNDFHWPQPPPAAAKPKRP